MDKKQHNERERDTSKWPRGVVVDQTVRSFIDTVVSAAADPKVLIPLLLNTGALMGGTFSALASFGLSLVSSLPFGVILLSGLAGTLLGGIIEAQRQRLRQRQEPALPPVGEAPRYRELLYAQELEFDGFKRPITKRIERRIKNTSGERLSRLRIGSGYMTTNLKTFTPDQAKDTTYTGSYQVVEAVLGGVLDDLDDRNDRSFYAYFYFDKPLEPDEEVTFAYRISYVFTADEPPAEHWTMVLPRTKIDRLRMRLHFPKEIAPAVMYQVRTAGLPRVDARVRSGEPIEPVQQGVFEHEFHGLEGRPGVSVFYGLDWEWGR